MKNRFSPFPVLHTNRLELRQATEKDVSEILFLRSDPHVNKFIKRKTPHNLQEAHDFLIKITSSISNGENIYWAIFLKNNSKMIGSICLWNFSQDRTYAEVGYDLHPDFQKKGLMSEALQAVLHYGFQKLNLTAIEAFTHFQNKNSCLLLIKNGFCLIENKKDPDNESNSIYRIKNRVF